LRKPSFFKKFALVGIATSFALGGLTAPASGMDLVAGDAYVAPEDQELADRLEAMGVEGEDQSRLISKWKNGQAWDSMTGVAPVSVTSEDVDGFVVTRSVFPDGSVSILSLEIPSAAPAPGTVGIFAKPLTGCKALPSSGGWTRRAECKADAVYGTYAVSFNVDYSVKSGGGRIDNTYNAACEVIPPYSVSNCSLSTSRKLNSGSVPAAARLSATFTAPIGGAVNAWVQLHVYGSAWVTNN